MKIKKVKTIYFIMLCLVLTSCATQKSLIQECDLCGMVVDENNKPISDFIISIKNDSFFNQTTITNNSGFFFFPNIKPGLYVISGEKENYVKFINRCNFTGNNSLYCCQVISLDEAIEKVNSYIKINDYQKGVDLLNNISVKNNELTKILVLSYLTYLNGKLGNKDICIKNIAYLQSLENENSRKIIKIMEKILYE